jgi:predicted lipid-binding transport protein (Tim44 family)
MPHAQMLEIAIPAMIAAVLLFRLYTVLGRRTGNEPTANSGRLSAPAAGGALAAAAAPSDPLARGLMDIALADRSFDKTRFLAGARTAYERIQKAYASGDRPALRPLLSDEVFAAFDSAISARAGAAPEETLAGITDARITEAALHGDSAEVTVAFRAQFLKGEVQRDVGDVWSFARRVSASDPNWALVATSGDQP